MGVARKFAPPDRNDVHLENRISRGAGWANRCIIVVWDCDRGFRRGLAVSNVFIMQVHRGASFMPILESKIYIRMIINYIMGKMFACLSEIT